jgi:NADPH:quinone reductase-like Zn-dependent oxidoreductase
MTAFDAMTLGTAGFTAAQAIMLMEHNGLKPENGPVAVTGATGGVGSAGRDTHPCHNVVAITGARGTLPQDGACEVLQRQTPDLANPSPDKSTGRVRRQSRGDILAWLLSTMKISRTVAQWASPRT